MKLRGLVSTIALCVATTTLQAVIAAGITRESMVERMATTTVTASGSTVKANGTERAHAGFPAYYYQHAGHPGAGHPVPGLAGIEMDPNNRDPRQWLTGGYGGYGSPMYGLGGFGSSEMLLTCLLVVLVIGVIGLPFLLLIFSAFSGGQGGGLNFIPPTTTTTVAGRKRRDLANLFPNVNPNVSENLLNILENFYNASDKMEYIKKMIAE